MQDEGQKAAILRGDAVHCRTCKRNLYVFKRDVFSQEKLDFTILAPVYAQCMENIRLACPFCLEPWFIDGMVHTLKGWVPRAPVVNITKEERWH